MYNTNNTYLFHKFTALVTVMALVLCLFSFISAAEEGILPFSALVGEEAARAVLTINGVPLTGGSTIEAPDDGSDFLLTAGLSFTIPADKIPDAISPGTSYKLEIPSILLPSDRDFTVTRPFQIMDEDRLLTLGTLTFSSEGILLTFDYPDEYFRGEDHLLNEEKINSYLSMLSNIQDCSIDFSWPKPQSELNASHSENVEVDIYGEDVTLHFPQYRPSHLKMVKSAQVDADAKDLIHWRVELTTSGQMEEGLIFRDFFPNQTYVDGSLRINGSLPSGDVILDTIENDRLFITFLNALDNYAAEGTILLTYSTRAADSAYAAAYSGGAFAPGGITLVNTADLTDPEEFFPLVSDSASLTLPAGWLNKQGKFDPQSRTISWMLVLNETGRSLTNVTLEDTMGPGLVLDESSLEISTDGISYSPLSVTPEIVRSDNYETQGDAFSVSLGDIGQKTYIRYTTHVIDSFYFPAEGEDNEGKAQNRAQLTFSFHPESGGGWDNAVFVTDPAGVGAGIASIAKSAVYDSATHTITWTLIVNNARAALQDCSITDVLQSGLTYIPGSVTIRYSDEYIPITLLEENGMSSDYDDTERKLTFTLGNTVDQKVAVITYQTLIDNPLDWAYNNSDTPSLQPAYSNTAVLTAKLYGEDAQGLAPAIFHVPSNVLRKSFNNYNYQNKTISCTLTINENQMPMPDGIIRDTLEEGLSFRGPMLVTGAEGVTEIPAGTEGSQAPYYTYDDTRHTLEINLGTLADNKTITLSCLLNVDTAYYCIENGLCKSEFNLKNTATLTRDDYPGPVAAEAQTPAISSPILDKKGMLNIEEGTIEYRILINKPGLDLNTLGYPCTLTDTMGPNVLPDLNSIKLYRVSIAPDGTPAQGSETELTGDSYSFSYTPGIYANTLNLTLPADTGTASYLLVYSVFVMETGNITVNNTISLNDQPPQPSGQQSVQVDIAHGSSFGWAQKKAVIRIQSVDSEGQALAGAEFTLYDESGKEIARAVSNENGMVIFIIDPDGNYIIKETKAPAGYQMSREWRMGKRITRIDLSNQYLWEDGSSTSGEHPAIAPHTLGEEPEVSPEPDFPGQSPSVSTPAEQNSPAGTPDVSPSPDNGPSQDSDSQQEDGKYFTSPQTGDISSVWTVLFSGSLLSLIGCIRKDKRK
ncbi:MAG: hypothetical protein J1E83_09715 [Lachnospiraceae bacterium]|nr:hypothetical protein [Lachnospiraceae bacterium]